MNIAQLMIRNVVTVGPGQTMREVVDLFRSHKIRHLPVVENSRLVGIVTDRDVKRATPSILSGGSQEDYNRIVDETLVSQIMTREPLTITEETPLKSALKILIERKLGALPVVRDGMLIGIVTEIDFLRAFEATLAD